MSNYYGLPTHILKSKSLELECLAEGGPRLVRLRYQGSANLFAELPQNVIPTEYGDYRYLGGHRLWHAPEGMPRSYIPDEDGLKLTVLCDGLVLEGKTEPGTGIRKRIEVRLSQAEPRVLLKHTLTNQGLWEVKLAPWGLSMFRLGGKVTIPTRSAKGAEGGLLPDRHIALWSYSRVDDPRLHLGDEAITLEARAGTPPLKIGTFAPQGWIQYEIEGVRFRKSFEPVEGGKYPDFGCCVECYCGDEFVELESLGPLTRLAPGETVEHVERWELGAAK